MLKMLRFGVLSETMQLHTLFKICATRREIHAHHLTPSLETMKTLCLFGGKIKEVVCLIQKKHLQCSTACVVPTKVKLPYLVKFDCEVSEVPCERKRK